MNLSTQHVILWLLWAALVVLKLLERIDITWTWVFAPVIASTVLAVAWTSLVLIVEHKAEKRRNEAANKNT